MPDQRTARADARPQLAPSTGVSWWGAVLIAVTATLIGLAIEAGLGHRELGGIFATFYTLGCLAAVLAVRQSGIFTAVIQPPLLLFVAVPLAYYLFHESAFGGLKDILINCGYPLIERFPLMLFTSAATLLVGLVRRYIATSVPGRTPARTERPGLLASLGTRLASAFAGNGAVDEEAGARPARPRHVVDRPAAARGRRPGKNAPTRSRHARRPVADTPESPLPPPRRRQPASREAPQAQWPDEPRRRTRQQRDPRRTPPPERRERRPDYRDQSPPRGSHLDPYESGRGYRPNYDGYPPYEPPSPRRRPPAPDRHPVSRVRYRDSGPPESDGRRR